MMSSVTYLLLNNVSDSYQCTGDKCQNGGTCLLENENFTCSCPYLFSGDRCEQSIDPCQPEPCDHGTCSAISLTDHICQCDAGYTGQNCSIDIDDCLDIDCGNGTCYDLVNDYTCDCFVGYSGIACMTNLVLMIVPKIHVLMVFVLMELMTICASVFLIGKEKIAVCDDSSDLNFPCDMIECKSCRNNTYTCVCV